ncbi:unnamed protein product [Darwinula stevensoni]|uniref:Tudor domain-containing protein n=1 Tax=Darwinula stevensoni TaxID=69355 RepID=A0A7R8X8U9_9CRUS|nr:unnamed protein product [Darwinula stevensoni]CAG0883760.1 unnamed protein product [Darwinula stevensoni]
MVILWEEVRGAVCEEEQHLKALQGIFHGLYGNIQAWEHEAIDQVKTLTHQHVRKCDAQRSKLADLSREISTLLRRAEEAVDDPTNATLNACQLSIALRRFSQLPIYLVQEKGKLKSPQSKEAEDVSMELLTIYNKKPLIQVQPKLKNLEALKESLLTISMAPESANSPMCLKSQSDLPSSIDLNLCYTFDDESSIIDGGISSAGSQSSMLQLDEAIQDNLEEPSQSKSTEVPKGTSQRLVPAIQFLQNRTSYTLEGAERGAVYEEATVVTHIKDPSCFYVVRKEDLPQLDALQKALIKWCESLEAQMHIPQNVEIDKMYAGKYSADQLWYRVRVKNVINTAEGCQAAEVLYIDYGNSEIIHISEMRVIPRKFVRDPDHAVCCTLHGIEPPNCGQWSEDSIRTFALLLDKHGFGYEPLTMVVLGKKGDLHEVDLLRPLGNESIKNECPISVAETLTFLGMALFRGTDPLSLLGQVGQNLHNFTNVMDKLQTEYIKRSGDKWIVWNPKKGMVCAAEYIMDHQWYRVNVDGTPGRQMVDVFYVDFGNRERIHVDSLRQLSDGFLSLPRQAIHCRLADISSSRGPRQGAIFSIEDSQAFASMVEGKRCRETELLSIPVVEELPRLETLIPEVEENPPTPPQKQAVLAIKQGRHGSKKKKSDKVNVTLAHFLSPSEFYIHLISHDLPEKLSKLMCILQETFQGGKKSMMIMKGMAWSPGDVCAARSSKSQNWHRGLILEVKDNESNEPMASVKMVDFGFKEDVPLRNLCPLPEHLCLEENFSVRCHLADVIPAGGTAQWSASARESLREILESEPNIYVSKMGEKNEEGSLPVDIYLRTAGEVGALDPVLYEYRSVSTVLKEKGLALPRTNVLRKESRSRSHGRSHSQKRTSSSPRKVPTASQSPSKCLNQAACLCLKVAKPEYGVCLARLVMAFTSATFVSSLLKLDKPFTGLVLQAKMSTPELLKPRNEEDVGKKKEKEEEARTFWLRQEDQEEAVAEERELNPVEEILLGQKDGFKREKGGNGTNSATEQDMIVGEEGEEEVGVEGEEEVGVEGEEEVGVEGEEEVGEEGEEEEEGGDEDADEGEEEWGESKRRKRVEEPVKITRWKRIFIPEENEYAALPTHVDYDGVIYLHNIDKATDVLLLIRDALNSKYGNSVAKPHDLYWFPGQPCIALYLDQNWHRGTVTKICNFDSKPINEEILKDINRVLSVTKINQDSVLNQRFKGWAFLGHVDPVPRQFLTSRTSDNSKRFARSQKVQVEDGTGNVEVFFVDYGTKTLLLPNQLRKNILLEDIPMQAIPCELYGVAPNSVDGKWPTRVLDFMHKTVVEKRCDVFVCKRKPHQLLVKLIIPSGLDLGEMLVNMRDAIEIKPDDREEYGDEVEDAPSSTIRSNSVSPVQFYPKEEDEVKVETQEEEHNFEGEMNPYPPHPPLEMHTFIPVRISAIDLNNPTRVFLQERAKREKAKDFGCSHEDFIQMESSLKHEGPSFPYLTDICLGTAATFQSSEDGAWYRCYVIKEVGDSECEVVLVDFGNLKIISRSILRQLPAHLVNVPRHCIACVLSNIHAPPDQKFPYDKSVMAEALSQCLFQHCQLYAYVKEVSTCPMVDICYLEDEEQKEDSGRGEQRMRLAYESLIQSGLIVLTEQSLKRLQLSQFQQNAILLNTSTAIDKLSKPYRKV